MKFIDLKTDRSDLVKISIDGLSDMHRYSIKPDFYKFLEFEAFKNVQETEEYLKKLIEKSKSENGHYWFIKLKSNKKVIGTFGILNIEAKKGFAEIGYGLSPDYWGKGYFKEVLKTVLNYLFFDLNFHRIWAKTQSNNVSSIKGLESVGFKKEGLMRDFYLAADGKRHNAALLSILSTEYEY